MIKQKTQIQHTAILTMFSLISLSGCTLGPQKPPTQFSSLITPEGLKLFEMSFPGPKSSTPGFKNTQTTTGWSDKKVLYHLKNTLKENQYCRNSYLILGRYAGETTDKIRGECKESATDNDQDRFPNTISRW